MASGINMLGIIRLSGPRDVPLYLAPPLRLVGIGIENPSGGNEMKFFYSMTLLLLVSSSIWCVSGCNDSGKILAAPSVDFILISSDGTGAYPTIQDAIFWARSGDVIVLADGIYSGEGNRDINFMGKKITVRSQNGNPELCVIDCRDESGALHRGFVFQNQEGSGSVLEGIGITNGNVRSSSIDWPFGGGILCRDSSSPTLRNLALVGNTASSGGGLACFGNSTPLVVESLFEGNMAQFNGQDIFCSEESSLEIVNSVLRDKKVQSQANSSDQICMIVSD